MEVLKMAEKGSKPEKGKRIVLKEGRYGLPPVKNKIKPPKMKPPKKD